MGRADAEQFVLECVRAWRELGAVVEFEPGWERRGNGQAADYDGGIIHHTGTGSSSSRPIPTRQVLLTGRPDLSPPLSNVAGPWCPPDRPLLDVLAAHPANHAGASGGYSMGPLPGTRTFNKRVLGLEIDYAGTVPMSDGQYRAALIFAAGVSRVLGRPSAEWVRGHAETSITGKWDPGYAPVKTIDLAAFRRQAWTLTQEDPMPTVDEILRARIDRAGPNASGHTTLFDVVAWSDSNLRQLRADVVADVRKLLAAAPDGPPQLTAADHDAIAHRVLALLTEHPLTPKGHSS